MKTNVSPLIRVESALDEAALALAALRKSASTLQEVARAATLLSERLQQGSRVYSCGNGGSMCDAMHFAEELSGKFRKERAALGAMAISDAAHLSCTANDFGYEAVFSRFVEGHGRAGDVLFGISTSGKSPNILKAADAAKQKGMHVIALTGKPGSLLAAKADIEICCPGGNFSDRVQELHIKVIHILIECVEADLFGDAQTK